MENIAIKIDGCGSYLPPKVLTNFDLEKIVETSDEWITQRTGIKERHIAENQTTSDMATNSILDAVKNSKSDVKLEDLDAIICATTTPDLVFPSTACIIQQKLGLQKNIVAFDIQAVCSGFVYAISVARDMMMAGKIKTCAVVGADKMSSIVDWKDRATCVLFGDGAGAVILKAENCESGKKDGIIDYELSANGNFADILNTNGGVSSNQKVGTVYMEGRAVFKHAVEKMTTSIKEIVSKNGFSLDDVALIVPHQANSRILTLVAEKLGIEPEKFMITIDKHANTSSASIPLALDVAIKQKMVKTGDLVILEALGGGLTWGAVLIRL